MNRLLFAILIFFSLKSNWIFAQINDNQTLDSIYIKALNSRFDFLLSSGTKFIEPNEQTERIKNNFKNSCGAFIRSEIWACIAPGLPHISAKYALEDAMIDHGDGEGTYAEVFCAVIFVSVNTSLISLRRVSE